MEERSSFNSVDYSNPGMESPYHNLSAREVTMIEGRGLNVSVALRNTSLMVSCCIDPGC